MCWRCLHTIVILPFIVFNLISLSHAQESSKPYRSPFTGSAEKPSFTRPSANLTQANRVLEKERNLPQISMKGSYPNSLNSEVTDGAIVIHPSYVSGEKNSTPKITINVAEENRHKQVIIDGLHALSNDGEGRVLNIMGSPRVITIRDSDIRANNVYVINTVDTINPTCAAIVCTPTDIKVDLKDININLTGNNVFRTE